MDTQSLKQLNAVMEQQVQAAQALAALLATERSLLTGNDPAAVEATAGEKSSLLTRIESLETDRRRVLAIAGRGATAAEMERLFRSAPPSPAAQTLIQGISALWSRLIDLMESCREANEVNGAIVGLKQRQVSQLLNILRTGREDALTYGPGGRARSAAARGLARA